MSLSRIAKNTGLTLDECLGYRIEYLKTHTRELYEDVAWFAGDTGELSPAFCQQIFEQFYLEARELHHLVMLSKGYPVRVGQVTDEMIEYARNYPIEQLVQFDQRGKALAFCHADNHPSLSWHRAKNRATCFPCAKSFNPIDILVERDGYGFRDAVKALAA